MAEDKGKRRPKREWSAEDDATLKRMTAEGTSVYAMGKALDRNPGTIYGRLEKLGIPRKRTGDISQMTNSKSLTLKERRQKMEERLIARAETLMERIEAERFQVVLRGGANQGEYVDEIDFVPIRDEQQASAAISTYMREARELARIDDDQGIGDTENMLIGMAKMLGLVGQQEKAKEE